MRRAQSRYSGPGDKIGPYGGLGDRISPVRASYGVTDDIPKLGRIVPHLGMFPSGAGTQAVACFYAQKNRL